MIDPRSLERTVVICPDSLKRLFLCLRGRFPDVDFTLYGIDEAVGLFSYEADYTALRYLIGEKGLSYSLASDELKVIKHLVKGGVGIHQVGPDDGSADKKLLDLLPLRDELLRNGYLHLAEYPMRSFESRSVLYFFLKDVRELSDYLSEGRNMALSFAATKDIRSLFGEEGPAIKEVRCFEDIYEEARGVMNAIAAKIDSGVSPDRIKILGADDAYYQIFEDLAPLYGFSINLPTRRRLRESKVYRSFRESYSDPSKTLEECIQELDEGQGASPDPNYGPLRVNLLRYQGLRDTREGQIALYDEIASLTEEKAVTVSPAVSLQSDYCAPKGTCLFIVNFSADAFPPEASPDPYFTDSMKRSLGLKDSLGEAVERQAILKMLLGQEEVAWVSYKSSPDGKSALSPLADELGYTKVDMTKAENEPPYDYSSSEGAYFTASLRDKKMAFGESDERLALYPGAASAAYPAFSYEYNGSYRASGPQKVSQSSLTDYYWCPFKYYCARVLRIDDSGSTFPLSVGRVFHRVLEIRYKKGDGFDFEAEFEAAVAGESADREAEGQPLSKKDLAYLENCEGILERAIAFYDEHEDPSNMDLTGVRTEFGFDVPVDDLGDRLTGRIDKAVVTAGKYLSIVDYKTGNSGDFDMGKLEFGLSVQLPAYAYAAGLDDRLKGFEPIGLFIGHLIPSTLFQPKGNKTKEETLRSHWRLDGVMLHDWGKLETIEHCIPKGGFVKAGRSNKRETIDEKGSKHFLDGPDFASLGKKAQKLSSDAADKMREGVFLIEPKRYKNEPACDKCHYRDVCYRSDRAMRNLTPDYDEDSEVSDEQ
jgi:RecB family exonuclease